MTAKPLPLPSLDDPLLKGFCRIALAAGELLMRYWHTEHQITVKPDGSPVTQADLEADALITRELALLMPGIPIVSEEGKYSDVEPNARFLLVDPLDGTKSFIRGGKNFTVNIGLVEHRKPVLGVVLAPVHELLYVGGPTLGAWRITAGGEPEAIRVRSVPETGHAAILGHLHRSPETDAFFETITVSSHTAAASSIKFCRIAEGSADIYPRFGRTMEWDTAAGQAVLEAAGGRVTTVTGKPFLYGKPGFGNENFIAWGAMD